MSEIRTCCCLHTHRDTLAVVADRCDALAAKVAADLVETNDAFRRLAAEAGSAMAKTIAIALRRDIAAVDAEEAFDVHAATVTPHQEGAA